MPDFLQDPNWLDVIIGFIALTTGTAITVYIFVKENKKKLLTFSNRYNSSLMFIEDTITPGIRITYNGKLVNNICIQEYEIHNSGNTPILASDFEKPVRLRFNHQPQIFSAEVTQTKPIDLDPKIALVGNDIVFVPQLLNPGDRIRVQVVLDVNVLAVIDARIAGISQISSGYNKSKLPKNMLRASFGMVFICNLIIMRDSIFNYWDYTKYMFDYIRPSLVTPLSIIALITAGFFVVVGIVSAIVLYRNWKIETGF